MVELQTEHKRNVGTDSLLDGSNVNTYIRRWISVNGVLSASKMMKAAEVRRKCAEMRSNPALLLAIELETKSKLFAMTMDKRSEAKHVG